MCFGSGGGDGGAQDREHARVARVKGSTEAIRRLFFKNDGSLTDARSDQLLDVENRIRDRFLPEFNTQTQDANRELKFALSRRGLGGGSAAIDAGERLSDRVAQGERAIGEKVIAGRNENERVNQNVMNNLLSQANADADRESLVSTIPQKQITAVNTATELGNREELGNLFGDVGSLFKKINDTSAFNRGANNQQAQFAAMFGNRNSGPRSSFGTVT